MSMGDYVRPVRPHFVSLGRRLRMLLIGAVTVLSVLVIGVWVMPRVLRESEVIRDLRIPLGSDTVRVVVVWSRNRGLLDSPNGPLIGGGGWRYTTTVNDPSGRELRFTTQLRPRTLWKSGDRLFMACCDGGNWLIVEITDGRLVPLSRVALPAPPPSWNLERAEAKAEWDQKFETWAR